MFDKLKQKLSGPFSSGEDRGVSPVIGVILMVAITVILAAVIGAFVLGLGDDLEGGQAPTVSTSISTNSDYDPGDTTAEEAFYIAHSAGDTVEADQLRVIVRNADGAEVVSFDEEAGWTGTAENADATLTIGGSTPGDFDPGSTITISDDAADAFAGGEYTLQVVHRGSGSTVSEQSVTL